MNEYDSNRIFDIVKGIGYEKSDDQKNADCYIINTCHIRDKANEKVFHEVGRIKKIYSNKNKPIMIIAGCVAQAEHVFFSYHCWYLHLEKTQFLAVLLKYSLSH